MIFSFFTKKILLKTREPCRHDIFRNFSSVYVQTRKEISMPVFQTLQFHLLIPMLVTMNVFRYGHTYGQPTCVVLFKSQK
jgi:hypothetical protein